MAIRWSDERWQPAPPRPQHPRPESATDTMARGTWLLLAVATVAVLWLRWIGAL